MPIIFRERPGRRTIIVALAVLHLFALATPGCAASGPQSRPGGNPSLGKIAIGRAACGSCHEIPNLPNAHGMVGPPLDHFSERTFIAGKLRNSPENLAFWLRFPQKVVPGNVMPDSGLNESEARDAAAYLETLK